MAEKETSKDRKEKRAAELVRLKQQWLDEGKPPYTTFFNNLRDKDETTVALNTFKKHLISEGYLAGDAPKSATPATRSNDSHFNDFLNRKVENQEALYLQWLKDERERLLALVKDLQKQLDAANPDR